MTLKPSNGATPSPTGPFTGTTDAAGQFQVTFTSANTGQVDGNATSNLTVLGVPLTRTTGDSHTGDGPDAVKTFVDAKIQIAGTATNRVGTEHTFTVTLWKDLGDGNGFVRFSGAHVDRSLQDKFGATSTVNAALTTCGVAGPDTDANGQCVIVINSNTTGQVVASASWTGSLLGSASFTVSTDGTGNNSGPATKTYVDAKISIAPSATNGITEPHTFTVTLWTDLGDGNGFVRFSGAHVDVTLTDAGGAVHTAPTGSCTNAGPNTDANGQCTISFTSNTAGTVTGHASWTGSILGSAQFTVSTGSGAPNSDDAVKTFVQGSLSWLKHDGFGNLLGGATFKVCATGGTAASLTPLCVTVVDNGPFDADPIAGQFKLNAYQSFGGSALAGLALGMYTIQETAAPAGYTLDPFIDSVTLTLANPNGSASHVWVNTRPGQGCTPGFWKNHPDAWDSNGDATVIALKAAITAAAARPGSPAYSYNPAIDGMTSQLFGQIFALSGPDLQGLDSNLTLMGALGLQGGGFNALARHGTAALLSSVSVQYPYKAAEVLDGVHNAFHDSNSNEVSATFPDGVQTDLAAANNLSEVACPTG